MAYNVKRVKQESFEQLKVLIAAFQQEYAVYKTSSYNEAQLRIDFINPLLKTFGWDVDNEATQSQFVREVVQEETIDVEEDDSIAKKNPDYTLRIQGFRKLFVEAKKVSLDIENSAKAAFQIRRYGWNANLGISILTNFETLIIYDCRYNPNAKDSPVIARYGTFRVSEFLNSFDKLYDLLSFQSVSSGYIDDYFSLTQKEVSTFDDYFLQQIETWRLRLAADIIQNNSGFNEEGINFLVQRLLNRIVFLRICEDREIEKYETLKRIASYDELKKLFIESDKKYNSGLFDFIEDNISLKINLKSETLLSIFNELYYPESPYDFSVVDPTILSQIYERYLGSKIVIQNEKEIAIVEEPEVAASSGVVPTPKLVVECIVKEALALLTEGKDLSQLQHLKIADICCGSGTFLLSVCDFLLEKITLGFIGAGITDSELIYRTFDGAYQLTLKAKQDILVRNIFGVDINPYAVEVTKFSLLLKILENERAGSIENYLAKHGKKVLPTLKENIKCGNSLVDDNYFRFNSEAIMNNELLYKVKPFNWDKEFPFLAKINGFHAIVGNPPYVRIQNLVKYSCEEVEYYKSAVSGYTVAASDTFDKYYLFVQRAVNLLNSAGVLGCIVPNKFFIVKGGKALRRFISSESSFFKIIHFGVQQVFPNRSTYTAILILDKKERENFNFRRIKNIATELIAGATSYAQYRSQDFQDQPWIFLSKESKTVFERLRQTNTVRLNQIAEIPVGLQTSADKIYIIKPHSETKTTHKFSQGEAEYEIEKAICKNCLHDLSFQLFDTVKPNAQLIFPYTIADGKAEVFSEEYFEKNFPLAWAYLNGFKTILSKRSINGGSKEPKWYQFGRSQSLTKFHNVAKLIWPVLSTKPSYIYDDNNLQFTGGGNGPYYSLISNTDYSPLFIMGILSHPLFEAMVKAGASEFRGAFYSHGKQFIENLPIRVIDFADTKQVRQHDAIAKLVKQLIDTKDAYNQSSVDSKRKVLQRKIDYLNANLINRINELYQITDAEIITVHNDGQILTPPDEEL